MSLICIWAEARNGVIGRGDQLPWHIPQELEQFKKRTMGKILLFGYRTLSGFKGRKLPGRTMELYTPDKFNDVCDRSKKQEIFIAGGLKTYQDFLPITDKIIRTVIDIDAHGDVYAPEVDWSRFELIHSENFTNGDVSWNVEEWVRR